MASDGTNVLFSSSSYYVCQSSDGGVTWTVLKYLYQSTGTQGTPIYANGYFFVGPFATSDLSSWANPGLNATGNIYVNGLNGVYYTISNAYSTQTSANVYFNPQGNASVATPNKSSGAATVSTYKAMVTRGNTALIPMSRTESQQPNLIMEVPLYSYNTSTTFWVPPCSGGPGQTAYIYAGS